MTTASCARSPAGACWKCWRPAASCTSTTWSPTPACAAAGYGKALLDWLKAEARRQDCARLQLDSGTHRQDAHAFYLRERLRIEAFHFGFGVR